MTLREKRQSLYKRADAVLSVVEVWNLDPNAASRALKTIHHARRSAALLGSLPYLETVLSASRGLPLTAENAERRVTLGSLISEIASEQPQPIEIAR
jgi:hypothetical protein